MAAWQARRALSRGGPSSTAKRGSGRCPARRLSRVTQQVAEVLEVHGAVWPKTRAGREYMQRGQQQHKLRDDIMLLFYLFQPVFTMAFELLSLRTQEICKNFGDFRTTKQLVVQLSVRPCGCAGDVSPLA